MEILIASRTYTGQDRWHSKMRGVVLVEKEGDVKPLWKLLCEQDDYWETYPELVQVAPKEITHESDLSRLCKYCGKTDIWDVAALKAQIPFIIYQEGNRYE